jgi:hypothetical protein
VSQTYAHITLEYGIQDTLNMDISSLQCTLDFGSYYHEYANVFCLLNSNAPMIIRCKKNASVMI